MSENRIIVGPGTGKRRYGKPGMYGGRSTGKRLKNGGFNNCVNVGYNNVTDKQWSNIFGIENMPRWKRELIERGEEI